VAELVSKIDCPVLILLGKKDIQVVWQLDGPIFDEMLKHQPNLKIAYAENANHVLKHEPRPLAELTMADIMASYNGDAARLDDQAVEIILDWLKAQV
jgi:uncharacterized protein